MANGHAPPAQLHSALALALEPARLAVAQGLAGAAQATARALCQEALARLGGLTPRGLFFGGTFAIANAT